MKTKNYITLAVLIALVVTTSAQARTSHSRSYNSRHHRSSKFVTIGPGLHLSTRIGSGLHLRTSIIPPIRSSYSYHYRRHSYISPWPRTVIVPRTVTIPRVAPVQIQPSTVTVWITNGNGSKSPVVLTRDGPWYIGPREERYFGLPTEDQLRPIYGLYSEPVEPEEITIYITAVNGAQLPITLVPTEEGYYGPKGELYKEIPTERQLQMIYLK